jgi:ubiquinone/menaquinone biosynthesis C-methylase UbiE
VITLGGTLYKMMERVIESNDQSSYDDVDHLFIKAKANFMNHGYYPSYEFLNNSFLKNQASLYLNALDKIETEDKTLLDIGCGRGGGLNVYAKYLSLKELHGCDLNKKHIDDCIKNNDFNIHYKVCSAEDLEYPDNSFDIVTNIESSHCYEDRDWFFKEVHRVLSPGGTFAYLDTGDNIKHFLGTNKIFKNVEHQDITKNVLLSCEEDMENFKSIEDEEGRKLLLSIATRAYDYYKNKGGFFIKVVCNKEKEIEN